MTGSDIENKNIDDKSGDEDNKAKAFGMEVSDVLLDAIGGEEDGVDDGKPNLIYKNMIDDHAVLGIWCGDHTTFTRTERIVYLVAFLLVALLVNAFYDHILRKGIEECIAEPSCNIEKYYEGMNALVFVFNEGKENQLIVDIGSSITSAIISTAVSIFAFLPFIKKIFQMESEKFNKVGFFCVFLLLCATVKAFYEMFGMTTENGQQEAKAALITAGSSIVFSLLLTPIVALVKLALCINLCYKDSCWIKNFL
mmetsp:Transcript_41620/g.48545  ORF Transcript_41620/g.48545 Transcript_41620/m.48545 type:complete len:253 (+) Transcript_41620:83-841(+)